MRINGISLSTKTHAEAIQTIKSVMAASTVKMELLQGEDTEENGGLSPDWAKWMKRYESGHQRFVESVLYFEHCLTTPICCSHLQSDGIHHHTSQKAPGESRVQYSGRSQFITRGQSNLRS